MGGILCSAINITKQPKILCLTPRKTIVLLVMKKSFFTKHENSFTLQSHGVGKYGRCLGEIILNEVNLNDLLITEGHAVKYDGGKR